MRCFRLTVSCLLSSYLSGASAATLLVTNGDILGYSGLISTTGLHIRENLKEPTAHWKLVWLGTFMLTVNFWINHVEDANRDPRLETKDVAVASHFAHLIGGFLVGLGTKVGNGCTSGHGICGISRWSKRSLVSVPIFTFCSMATTAVLNGPAFEKYTAIFRTDTLPVYSKLLGTLVTASVAGLGLLRTTPPSTKQKSLVSTEEQAAAQKKVYGAAASAILSALGLIVSGMIKKSKVTDFLDLCAFCRSGGKMDPTLMTVLGSAIFTSWLGYQWVQGWNTIKNSRACVKPLAGGKFCIPTSNVVDGQLMACAAVFGIGWGMTSVCPGPALYHAAAGMSDVILVWFPSFYAGSWMGVQVKNYLAKSKEKKSA